MEDLIYIGQWQGFFQYGPEYGDFVEGKEAEFRLFIEGYLDGQFTGRVIDWEGLGVNGEIADVKGFISDNLISFTKQYPKFYIMDEWGNCETKEDVPGHQVVYEGTFDKESNTFSGNWEIVVDLKHTTDITIQDVVTGTWRMQRQS